MFNTNLTIPRPEVAEGQKTGTESVDPFLSISRATGNFGVVGQFELP